MLFNTFHAVLCSHCANKNCLDQLHLYVWTHCQRSDGRLYQSLYSFNVLYECSVAEVGVHWTDEEVINGDY